MKAPHEIFSRLEIGEELAERGVLLDDNHLKLLLSFTELEGVIVNGELNGSRRLSPCWRSGHPARRISQGRRHSNDWRAVISPATVLPPCRISPGGRI